jgi:spermidine synthase
LEVVHNDARAYLRSCNTNSADAIVGDAFVGRETPRHLASAEFVTDVARVLRPRGFYMVNLIDAPPWPVLSAQAATVRTALPHLLAAGAPEIAQLRESGNVLLVASRRVMHRPTVELRLGAGHRDGTTLVAGGRLAALARHARPRYDADG